MRGPREKQKGKRRQGGNMARVHNGGVLLFPRDFSLWLLLIAHSQANNLSFFNIVLLVQNFSFLFLVDIF